MILSWYRQNANDFSMVRATRLLSRVVWRRAYVKTCNALFRTRVECPCCGWRGNRFLDYIEMGYTVENAACPRCDSHSHQHLDYLKKKYNVVSLSEFQKAKRENRVLPDYLKEQVQRDVLLVWIRLNRILAINDAVIAEDRNASPIQPGDHAYYTGRV